MALVNKLPPRNVSANSRQPRGLLHAKTRIRSERTPFEAYQLLTEPTRPSQTFEGAFAWIVHTQAYAEDEWTNAEQWNPPTMTTIAPGATIKCPEFGWQSFGGTSA